MVVSELCMLTVRCGLACFFPSPCHTPRTVSFLKEEEVPIHLSGYPPSVHLRLGSDATPSHKQICL